MKNMKKYLGLSLLASALFLGSCQEELLEPFTPGSLTDEVAVTTSADLQRLLNSTYANSTNREEAYFSSVFTDECSIGVANGGQGINNDFIFQLNQSSASPSVIWQVNAFALSRATRVIDFADRIVPVNAADAQLIARMKAEALLLRAYSHLRMMSYFSPDPKNDSALAGVLADRVITSADANLSRSTNAQFYTSIHNDCNTAISILASNTATPYSATTKTYFANAIFAKGLKARAYALKGDYVNAEIWADDVINTSGIVLANPAQYQSVFFSDNEPANTEVIFRLKRTTVQNTQASNLHNAWCSVRPTRTGSLLFEVSRSLFNKVNANPSDIRRNVIAGPTSLIDPSYATSSDFRNTDVLVINKHGGAASGTTSFATTASGAANNDHKAMRVSEMYLIKAEARAFANDFVGAATAIKAILDKRYPTAQTLPVYANATATWKAILDERRIELAYEGFRYIDLKRLGTLAGLTTVDRDAADYTSSSANYPGANPANFSLTSFKMTLPIPQVEIIGNVSIQQNPGY